MKSKQRRELSWKILSSYRSQIMGIAIIWIMLFHWPELFRSVPLVSFVTKRGMTGVEMFLLVSGIGLFYSMTKNENVKEFYIKRALRVLIPYLVISLPYWIWQDLWVKKDIGKFFLDYSLLAFWKSGDREVWYIALILGLYAVYPLIFKCFLKGGAVYKKAVLMALSLILPLIIYAVNPSYFAVTEIAFWRISSFVLGSLLAVWVMEGHKFSRMQFLGIAAAAIGTVAIVIVINHMVSVAGIFRVVYLPIGFICCFLSAVILWLLDCSWLNRLLSKFGACSLELYLIHIFLRSLYEYYVLGDGSDNSLMNTIVIPCITIALSIVLSMLAHKLIDKIKLGSK
ncbi:acyltransferase family protein [Faecalicatena orotica]|nr:acyltransferase [Faecalicatena orotica]